ncbi:hypothetical protein MLD38_010606 [Melastoma candidum]|uniref:Uncharacterized protein n=1 Tax=Melastoma candidum TaxID=119954 RepID=A0ACB9R0Y2_9MYRT|nr:hypothetical protein MLD38_010606 [Melastoma candidum]
MADFPTRVTVVTGANKGIGFGICKLLATKGVTVVLTARDEKRGLEAVRKLKEEEGLSNDNLVFHQLEVTDAGSISTLVEFVRAEFGKLDILVNNAGVPGATMNVEALQNSGIGQRPVDWSKIATESYEQTEYCMNINYYGAKRMIEAFLPLLHLSKFPRVVNVSSSMGKLMFLPDGWAKGVLSDGKDITEEKVKEVAHEYLKDYKAGLLESRGWPKDLSAYKVSKALLNGYTRAIAKKHPNLRINCVCPGFVKTDINYNAGHLTIEEGAEGPTMLALLPDEGPTGAFFSRTQEGTFD